MCVNDVRRQVTVQRREFWADDFVMGRANVARILGDLNYWHETLSMSIVDIIDRVTKMEIDKIIKLQKRNAIHSSYIR